MILFSVFRLLVLFVLLVAWGCSPNLSQKNVKIQEAPFPTATIDQNPVLLPSPTRSITLVSGAMLKDSYPGEPQGSAQIIHDQTCATPEQDKRASGGDEYSTGRFERPFDKDMNYLPALDISRVELFRPHDDWIYFRIHLEAQPAQPPATYGVELDLNIDGRGDLLIQVPGPSSPEWTESGMKMWWDSDGDVGGQVVNRTDPKGFRGSGFETLKTDSDSDKNPGQIWVRLKDQGLEIVVLEELVGGADGKFTWKPYSDGNPFSPTQYDINDYYSLKQAGSALIGERDYPLKAVYAIDNTCRGLSGLTPSGKEQGVCPL